MALPEGVNRALLLVAREAIRSAVAHAAPTAVNVRMSYTQAGIRLEIRDDGAGFEAPSGCLAAAGHFRHSRNARAHGADQRRARVGKPSRRRHDHYSHSCSQIRPVAILPTPIPG